MESVEPLHEARAVEPFLRSPAPQIRQAEELRAVVDDRSAARSESLGDPLGRDHIAAADGRYDAGKMKTLFADPACGVCVGKGTIDMMVFDCTAATAYLSRGPSYKVDWKTFTFGDTR